MRVGTEDNPLPTEKQSRLVVIGSTYRMVNNCMQALRELPLDFYLNAIRWLARRESEISISPRHPKDTTLIVQEVHKKRIKWTTVYLMPLLALIAGFVVRVLRRR
jgi:ABC-type uncharacterized transport system involved in gliding motility auxiliary subunit